MTPNPSPIPFPAPGSLVQLFPWGCGAVRGMRELRFFWGRWDYRLIGQDGLVLVTPYA